MASFEIDPERSSVEIAGSSSLHPIHARSNGLSGWFEVSLSRGKLSGEPELVGEVSIPVDRLGSGNPLVDRETRRRLDSGRYPEITGKALGSRRVDDATIAVSGAITLRGEIREVTGELVVSAHGDDLVLTGSSTFDVRDWGLKPPRVGLLKVHPQITVDIVLHGSRR